MVSTPFKFCMMIFWSILKHCNSTFTRMLITVSLSENRRLSCFGIKCQERGTTSDGVYSQINSNIITISVEKGQEHSGVKSIDDHYHLMLTVWLNDEISCYQTVKNIIWRLSFYKSSNYMTLRDTNIATQTDFCRFARKTFDAIVSDQTSREFRVAI